MLIHIRRFFTYVVPALWLISALAKYYYPGLIWADISFAILLASMVGFYTNFIAIKMLFRPQNPTIFGRQGLIPKKQTAIAHNLGQGINEQFFNAQELQQYLEQKQLLHKATSAIKSGLLQAISKPSNQRQISLWLSQQLTVHNEQISQYLVKFIEQQLTQLLSQQADVSQLASKLGDYLEQAIADGTINIEQVVDKVTEVAAENIPDLARWLHQQFEDYNQSQGVFKRNFINFLKWSSDIDEPALREQLYRLISTMEFRAGVYKLAERMLHSVGDYLQTDQGQVHLAKFNKALNQYLLENTKAHIVPSTINQLEQYLASPEAWDNIQRLLDNSIDKAELALNDYMHSPAFAHKLEHWLPVILEQFDVHEFIKRKVNTLDTNRLEQLVLSAAKQHLVMIEILGGVLGAFAGIALFSMPAFLAVLGVTLIILAIEYWLTHRQNTSETR